jgi:ABC-type dipeptide/oligopeptide/nickel transport system ATPase component
MEEHVKSYYAATAHRAPEHAALAGDVTADVCVIGGGLAGCSTALHLAERGYSVVLLEANRVGWGASGRNGGQTIFGFAANQDKLVAQVGFETARRMFEVSVEALDLVDLPNVELRFPAELSGGMRKRVGIARAIALRPKYILYDEPTTGLDPVTSAVIDQLMVRMRDRLGVTSIVITHDMRSAYTVGTRIAMLYEGRVRQVGTVDEIQHTTDPVVRQFIEGRPTLDPEIQEQQA